MHGIDAHNCRLVLSTLAACSLRYEVSQHTPVSNMSDLTCSREVEAASIGTCSLACSQQGCAWVCVPNIRMQYAEECALAKRISPTRRSPVRHKLWRTEWPGAQSARAQAGAGTRARRAPAGVYVCAAPLQSHLFIRPGASTHETGSLTTGGIRLVESDSKCSFLHWHVQ